ncbi:MAG: hypothetical protein B7Z10_00835 [Rhodobacterales bacterium 32-66-7]|nr:MAG: hypothetical protein B7Z31_09925 [Rhodobacterales bacterium 12-65-15]OYX27245.1 MAG: hypothetical protein B7Z10_00835 [Rhodobacterales bacterium 32-66-7]OZA13041.1 MAG: hypothetical protein B7Y02_06565 [Rhodobacterales bacterium 17-64-5]
MRQFKASVRKFCGDESGILLAEALITLPLLIWGFVALFVYWDVYKTINVTQKAAYSISDLLSRQVVVTDEFVEGLSEVLTFLTPGTNGSRMRITSIEFDEGSNNQPLVWDGDDHYHLLFSCSSDEVAAPPHTNVTIQALEPQIPRLKNLRGAIIVETWTDYVPDFDIGLLNAAPGLSNQTFENFVVTSPRDRRVCLEGGATECSVTSCN